MKKYLYTILFVFIVGAKVFPQSGINTTTVDDGVMFQIDASDKGVLFPRMALTSNASTLPLPATIPTGTMVFNTATADVFPNTIIPGLHYWSAEEQRWINAGFNINTVMVKYTNSESTINYNTETWQNVQLFGNNIINESLLVYDVNTTEQSVTVNRSGLYSIAALLSFDRGAGGIGGRVSLSTRVYVNDIAVGTEHVISPGYTSSVGGGRGLFSQSFIEYLELADGDVVTVKIRRTVGTYSGTYGTADVFFLQSGDSSITIQRIR